MKNKKIDFQDIADICDVARFAPMAGNIFTLKILIISDKKKIEEISEIAQQPFLVDASYILVVCSQEGNVVKSFSDRGKRYARQQAGAAIQNMLLKIEELGLASCWIGWFDDNALKRALKIPSDVFAEAIIPIAQGDGKAKKIFKPELKSIVFFEEWGKKDKEKKENKEI